MSQINPVHTLHPTSWRSFIILYSHLHLGLPSGILPSGFPPEPYLHLSFSPVHQILLDLVTPVSFGEENTSWSFHNAVSLLHSPLTSSLLGPDILLNTLFPNTLNPRSSLNVTDHVSHPYNTAGNITVLYILMFIFLYSGLEDRRLWTE